MSAFLLRLEANYLEKVRRYPHFSFWIPIALGKIYFFPRGPNLAQKPLYLVGTVLDGRDMGTRKCEEEVKVHPPTNPQRLLRRLE